jgi:kynurenine formamidase
MSLHTGCHVESALHCIENGEPIEDVSLDRVIGSGLVLDLTPVEAMQIIDVPDLKSAHERLEAQGESVRPGDIILLRTDWSQRMIGTPEYFRHSPGLTEAAAQWLIDLHPKCIGCDFFEEPAARQPDWTVDQFVVHRVILGAAIPIAEGLINLRELPPRFQFFAPFYSFAGIDSAPARAFAVVTG